MYKNIYIIYVYDIVTTQEQTKNATLAMMQAPGRLRGMGAVPGSTTCKAWPSRTRTSQRRLPFVKVVAGQ